MIFADDTDVIFEDGTETRFYRYLLTKLDGLESSDAGLVCIIMTAMSICIASAGCTIRTSRNGLAADEVAGRSGANSDSGIAGKKDVRTVSGDSHQPDRGGDEEGFSGADLKRLVEDAEAALRV